jgi:hypothetical protein
MTRHPWQPPRWRAALLVLSVVATPLHAWGPQGHRLVARVATDHLTPTARQNVGWLLGHQTLADVAVWADQFRDDNRQTGYWHYTDIPPEAKAYDRDRDCPRQPGVAAGDRADKWRDCAVDRILYNQERLANTSLDRADRAIALKFLVHLVGDLHQPFHALSVERGGNGIPVSAFGSPNCAYDDGTARRCNLHMIWDTTLIGHRGLTDTQYLAALGPQLTRPRDSARLNSSPKDWAVESHDLAIAALLKPDADAGDAYFRTQIAVIDERLALAGLRLAALLNRSLTTPPPAR